MLSKKNILYFLSLFLIVVSLVGLDQVTKIKAENTLMTYEDPEETRAYQGRRYPVKDYGSLPEGQAKWSDFFISFNFNYVRNHGAAWGFLSDLPDSVRDPFFYLVTLFATCMVIYFFLTTPVAFKVPRFALLLVFSGAIGNVIDRVRIGYVIDWIDIRWLILGWRYPYPNFNVADSCISIGVAILLVDLIFLEKRRIKKLS